MLNKSYPGNEPKCIREVHELAEITVTRAEGEYITLECLFCKWSPFPLPADTPPAESSSNDTGVSSPRTGGQE